VKIKGIHLDGRRWGIFTKLPDPSGGSRQLEDKTPATDYWTQDFLQVPDYQIGYAPIMRRI
jgi:hypothetical protein